MGHRSSIQAVRFLTEYLCGNGTVGEFKACLIIEKRAYPFSPPLNALRSIRNTTSTYSVIQTIVDVRLRPDRTSLGIYAKAKDPAKGIEGVLPKAGIGYVSLVELGNIFRDFDDLSQRYQKLLEKAGDLLIERLLQVLLRFCLLCAEKDPNQCHRKIIADYLQQKGYLAEHIR